MSEDRAVVQGVTFQRVTLGDDELTGDHFYGCDFVNVNFGDNADMVFENCRFDGCIFEGDISGSQFLRCSIDGCVFRSATADDTGFLECNLTESAFQSTSLFGSIFADSILERARIQDCDARSAVFENCNLDSVMFDDTNLSDAHLATSFGLADGQLEAALGDRRTVLPEWMLRPDHWDRDDIETVTEIEASAEIPGQIGAPLRVLWKGDKLIPDPRGGGAETLRRLQVADLFRHLKEDVDEVAKGGPHNHPIFRYVDRLSRELAKGITLVNPVAVGYQVELIRSVLPDAREALVESTCSMLEGIVTGGSLFSMQFPEWREITSNLDSRNIASADGVVGAQLYYASSALRQIAKGIRASNDLIDRRVALILDDHADDLMGGASNTEIKTAVARSSSNFLSALLAKAWVGAKAAGTVTADEAVRLGARRFLEDHESHIRRLVALAPAILKWAGSILDKLLS